MLAMRVTYLISSITSSSLSDRSSFEVVVLLGEVFFSSEGLKSGNRCVGIFTLLTDVGQAFSRFLWLSV
jgi:hypothetical protein